MPLQASRTRPGAALPTLTVVIASKNRSKDIHKCLSSIRAQRTQPDEIIVIDQSETPYDLSSFGPIVHVYNPRLKGLTAARNASLDLIRSDLVLFLDDDVELTTDCVAYIADDFVRRPKAIGLGLNITWPESRGVLARFWRLIFEHGFFNYKPIRRRTGTELRRVIGCAMAFRFWLFSHERFDESLTGYGLGEDLEFSVRSRRRGELWMCDRARVVHHVSPANRTTRQSARRDRWAHGLYFYDKLDADRQRLNRLWRAWWMFGESLRWLRLGMGVPKIKDRLGQHVAIDNGSVSSGPELEARPKGSLR
jgi:glycosyltransferase involved in cell wall biosynthesis